MESNTKVGRKIPRQRFVTGGFGNIGYIAKRPGHGKATEDLLASIRKVKEDIIKSDNERKAIQKDALLNDQRKKWDMIVVRASAARAIQLAMDQASRDLDHKRNKLKSILLSETSEHIAEYTRKALESNDKRMEVEKRKAEEIMKISDDSENRRAQEAYAKLAMESSDLYKSKLRMEKIKEVQEANREMVRLKHLHKSSGRDDEVYWRAEADQRFLRGRERSELEDVFRRDDMIIQRQSLRRQMEDRIRIQKNNACVEEIEEQKRNMIRDAQFREWELRDEKSRRREALGYEALAQQIVENKAAAKMRQQEEMLADKIMLDDNRKKLEREMAAIQDQKKQAWKELVLFRQSMVEYRNARQAESDEIERQLDEWNKEIEVKKEKQRRAKKYMRKDLAKDCFETSRRLASEKIARDSAMRQRNLEEDALLAHYNDINNKLSEEHKEKKTFVELDPTPFNDEFIKYSKVIQERQRQEERDIIESNKRLEDERKTNAMAVLERPLEDFREHKHPMYKILLSRHNL